MSATSPSQYIDVMITPEGSRGLTFSMVSKDLSLAALPGNRRIRVILAQGSFADLPNQGGTGREEGYTDFDLTNSPSDASEFTLHIENLQPDDTSRLVQGTAVVLLQGQQVTLRNSAQQSVELDVAGAVVTLAEVHFVVATLTPHSAFTVKYGAELVTATSKANAAKRVCIAFRDNGPLGLQLIPGSRHFIFRAAPNDAVPPMDLTFHLPDDQDQEIDPEDIRVFFHRSGNWEKMPAAALAADQRSISVSTIGQNTFALSAPAPG